jgi:tetratricopeptide (TPR) repeat protein
VPSDLRYRVQEARIERRAGNARRAVELLAPLPEVDRLEEGVSLELAASFTALGEHARAAAVWLARHRNSPNAGDAVRAAESSLDAGDREAAADLLREAQLLAPDSPEVAALAARLDPPA